MELFRCTPPWLGEAPIVRLFDAVAAVGEARVVGGAVRNTLLGAPLGDVDLATDATPDRVARAAREAGLRVHETGLDHGTLTIVCDGHPFEVTTLREDVTTDGRRATVRYTTDWALDAGRRDFTMNALYLARDGTGYDYVGGHADCLARHVRFIGDPDRRILEDHLRILRFFRVHAAHGAGDLDAEGLAACRRGKTLLRNLAVERIQHELTRLLAAPGGPGVADVLAGGGFLDPFLPAPLEVPAYRALADAERAAGRATTPVLALAALVGLDADRFARAADTLRLSRKEGARGLAAIAAARAMPPRSAVHFRGLLYDHGAEAAVDGLMLARAEGVAVENVPHLVAEAARWQRPRLPVSGHDLKAQGGPVGRALGERLKHLEAIWRDSDFALGRDALLALDRAFIARNAADEPRRNG